MCDKSFLVSDFDFVEYTYIDGVAVPVALVDAKEIPNSISADDIMKFIRNKITRNCGIKVESSLECYESSSRLQNIPFCVYFLRESDDLGIVVSFNDLCDTKFQYMDSIGEILPETLQATVNGISRSLPILLTDFSDLNNFLSILRNSA